MCVCVCVCVLSCVCVCVCELNAVTTGPQIMVNVFILLLTLLRTSFIKRHSFLAGFLDVIACTYACTCKRKERGFFLENSRRKLTHTQTQGESSPDTNRWRGGRVLSLIHPHPHTHTHTHTHTEIRSPMFMFHVYNQHLVIYFVTYTARIT